SAPSRNQSSAPRKEQPASSQTQQTQQKQSDVPQANEPVDSRGTVAVFPTSIHFGNVQLSSPQSVSRKDFRVENQTSAPVNVYPGGFVGEDAGEFSLDQKCESGPVKAGESCEFLISFSPKKAGDKLVKMEIQSAVWKQPVTISVDGSVRDSQNSAQPPSSTP